MSPHLRYSMRNHREASVPLIPRGTELRSEKPQNKTGFWYGNYLCTAEWPHTDQAGLQQRKWWVLTHACVCVFQWALGFLLKLLWWWAWCWRVCPSHWLMEAPSPWTDPLLSATGQSAKTVRTQTHTSLIKSAETRQCKHLYFNTTLLFKFESLHCLQHGVWDHIGWWSYHDGEKQRRVCVCVNTWGMNTGHRFN